MAKIIKLGGPIQEFTVAVGAYSRGAFWMYLFLALRWDVSGSALRWDVSVSALRWDVSVSA